MNLRAEAVKAMGLAADMYEGPVAIAAALDGLLDWLEANGGRVVPDPLGWFPKDIGIALDSARVSYLIDLLREEGQRER